MEFPSSEGWLPNNEGGELRHAALDCDKKQEPPFCSSVCLSVVLGSALGSETHICKLPWGGFPCALLSTNRSKEVASGSVRDTDGPPGTSLPEERRTETRIHCGQPLTHAGGQGTYYLGYPDIEAERTEFPKREVGAPRDKGGA